MTDSCLVCGKPHTSAFMQHDGPPWGGTTFTAAGNFGSGWFDWPPDGQSLKVTVCDTCLMAAGQAGRVSVLVTARQPVVVDEKMWVPDDVAPEPKRMVRVNETDGTVSETDSPPRD